MIISRLVAIIGILIAAAISTSSNASIKDSGFSNAVITGSNGANSVKMRCYLDADQFLLSVVTVLKLQDEAQKFQNRDVAVTTGHGLVGPDGKVLDNCFVYGPTGRKYDVSARMMAPGFKNAAPSDWAVIVFDEIRDKKLLRYAVDPTLSFEHFEALSREQAEVQFTTARGILKNGQGCHLYPRDYASLKQSKYDGIIPHSCKSIRGQSGSPVSVAADGHEVLVGIHVGQSFSLPVENVTDRARWYGYMRIVDDTFLDALSTILKEIELDD